LGKRQVELADLGTEQHGGHDASLALIQQDLIAFDLIVQRGDLRLSQPLAFRLAAGSILHILGRNGAGKSTLLQQCAGLLPVYRPPMLRWAELSPADWPLLYIGHRAGLNAALSVRANLTFILGLNGVVVDDYSEAFAQVGLAGYEDALVAELSAGQKRRVSLARLWLDADHLPLWILDEPFSALDSAMVATLCARIADYVAHDGRVILTSHQHHTLSVTTLNLDDLSPPLDADVEFAADEVVE
jgi:heme exporter protein A